MRRESRIAEVGYKVVPVPSEVETVYAISDAEALTVQSA